MPLLFYRITSSDYTVVVQNPPPDAFNPDEWRDFFTQFASKQVTAVTIALNNEKLLRKLIQRRRHRNNLRMMLPKHTNMDDEVTLPIAVAQLVKEREQEGRNVFAKMLDCIIFPILRVFGMFLPPEQLLQRSSELTEEIKDLLNEKYDVTKVFVTFETEEGQRAALTALSVAKLDVYSQNTSKIAPSTLFRDNILVVTETAEASAIRWLDLSASTLKINMMRVVTFFASVLVVGVCGYLVAQVRFTLGAGYAAPLVSVLNTLIPMIVKILMLFEPHHQEGKGRDLLSSATVEYRQCSQSTFCAFPGEFQSSLFTKITLFRWTNTALLAKMITPWTSTLGSTSSNM
jgi:hypothetical protein